MSYFYLHFVVGGGGSGNKFGAGGFSFSHDLPRDAVRHGTDVHARVRGSKGTGDDARPRQGVGAAAVRHNDNARQVYFLLCKSEEKVL